MKPVLIVFLSTISLFIVKAQHLELPLILGKNLAVSAHYDSDMGWGVGVTLNY